MTRVLPSSAYAIRRELGSMVYAAITESNLQANICQKVNTAMGLRE